MAKPKVNKRGLDQPSSKVGMDEEPLHADFGSDCEV